MTDMQNTEWNRQDGLTDDSRGTGHPAPGSLTPSQSQDLLVSLSVIADGRLQVYTPTNQASNTTKNEFYKCLQQVYKGQGRNQCELMTRAYWEFLVNRE